MADSSYLQDAEFMISKAPGATEELAKIYIELAKVNALISIAKSLETIIDNIAQSMETAADHVRYKES